MGTALTIELVRGMAIEKDSMAQGNISRQELEEKLERELHFPLAIFDCHESADVVGYSLKEDLFRRELVPLLERIFVLLYPGTEIRPNATLVLERLRVADPGQWAEIAAEKSLFFFQRLDSPGDDVLYYGEKDFRPRLRIRYESILLSEEGKTFMEVYGRQFRFFKFCMKEALKEFALAGALRVALS